MRRAMAGPSSDDLIDPGAVAAYCDTLGLGSGPVHATRIGEGRSNVTYRIERAGLRLVLRRPPRPPLPPSAHDMVREAGIIAALHGAGGRVPDVIAVCEDEAVLGVPFYLMEEVDGVAVTDTLPAAIDTPPERARLAGELIEVLVALHAIDVDAAGLAGFGRPQGYLERQVRRFAGLWEVNRTRDLPGFDEMTAWLADRMPESGPATVVHGDYRLGNVLVGRDAPARILAVLDWELATVGDPLADVGYLISMYRDRDSPDDAYVALSPVTVRDGFPTRPELAVMYEQRSGRSVERLAWYEALAHWKAVVFLEAMWQRFLRGDRDDEFARSMEHGVPQKLAAAQEAAARYDAVVGR
jgi:aminoglycoside phosphotransferase (APT) family kinase protein